MPDGNRSSESSDREPLLESTAVLLMRVREGEADATNQLVRRYLEPLCRWASGRLPGHARDLVDTVDVVQEAIIQSLRHVDRFESEWKGAFHGYLRRAVLNRIRDQIRRAQVRDVAVEKAELIQERPSPLDEVIGLEAVDRYESALARLKPAEREMIVARIEMDQTYQEIAVFTGKSSADAARMAVKRSIEKLARLMGE